MCECDLLEKLSLSGLLSAGAVCSWWWWCTHSIHVCKVNALKSLTCNEAKRASISTASDSVRLRTERSIFCPTSTCGNGGVMAGEDGGGAVVAYNVANNHEHN